MHKIKVLHCIPSLGGGGAERQLAYLSREMVNQGLEVHVAYIYDGVNSNRLQASGATVHKLLIRSNHDPRLFIQLAAIMRKVRPDIIQTWITQMDIVGGAIAKVLRIPYIVSERCSALHYADTWKDKFRLFMGKKASYVVANSESGREYWVSKGKHPDFIKTIRNGIPFEEINETPVDPLATFGVSSETELIVFAGRYSAQKNLHNLMQALKQVLDNRPKASAFLFGDGPLKDELVAIQEQLGFGNRLNIMGFSTGLWGIFKRANVFVSVSHCEGVPNTVLEAVVCGCPVVLSDIPEHREFLSEDAAYFVSLQSPVAIANGMIKALSDVNEAKLKSQRAYHEISNWSVEFVTREYINLYRNIIG